jgi:transposase
MQVALTFGVSRRSVGDWVRAYQARGEESFRPARRGRRAGEQFALSETQQGRILGIIVAGPPDRIALPCLLWTRRAVAELIRRDLGITLSSSTVGRYLRRWGIDAGSVPWGQAAPAMDGPVGAEELRVAWKRPRLPLAPDPAHALLAVTGRGVLHFLAGDRPFDLEALDDLRHRLRMQLARDVRIVVHSWPPEHVELLESWLSRGLDVVPQGARL